MNPKEKAITWLNKQKTGYKVFDYKLFFHQEKCKKAIDIALEEQAKEIFKKFIKDLNRIDKSSYCGLDNSEVTSDVIDKLKRKYGVKGNTKGRKR